MVDPDPDRPNDHRTHNFRCVALSAKEGECCKDMSRSTISLSSPVCVSRSVHVSVIRLNEALIQGVSKVRFDCKLYFAQSI